MILLERGAGLPLESSARSYLALIAFLTFKVVARKCTTEAETTKATERIVKELVQKGNSSTKSEEVTTNMSGYDLELIASKVT